MASHLIGVANLELEDNKIIHIVHIASGCIGNCSYCIVKFARGKIVSFPQSNIIKDIQNALSEGCKEIWITAEDTAAYNYEGITLDKLLKSITDLPTDFKIRVGMMTPNQALKISESLIEVYKNDKIFKFLHVPVQSGSNEVLVNMNRYYKDEGFKNLISKFRSEIPNLSVSTDIICGFPGETREQFNESLELIEWLRPDVLNISKFGLRPRTEAGNMKQIPGYEIKIVLLNSLNYGKKLLLKKITRDALLHAYVEQIVALTVKTLTLETPLFWSVWGRRAIGKHRAPMTGKNIWRLCKLYGRLIGYPMLKPHDIRHGVAMEVLEQRHDLEQVRALLGHQRIDTTQIYTMIRAAQLKRAVSFYEEPARQMLESFRSEEESMFEEHSHVPQTRSIKLQ